MTYLAILLMMLIAFAVVGWPLMSSPRGPRRQPAAGSPPGDLIDERDAAYRAIKELDFEYDLGNLSESDYRTLRDRYRSEAAATLQKLDTVVQGEAPPVSAATSTTEAPTGSPQAGLTCPSCGNPAEAGDSFCRNCGAQLGPSCPTCSGSVLAGDRFCAACGAPLEAEA